MDCQSDEAATGVAGSHEGGRREAIQHRHGKIHDDDVGAERYRLRKGLAPVGRLAYDLHVAGDLEKQAKVCPYLGAVVDDEDPLCLFMFAHATSMSRGLRRHIGQANDSR